MEVALRSKDRIALEIEVERLSAERGIVEVEGSDQALIEKAGRSTTGPLLSR